MKRARYVLLAILLAGPAQAAWTQQDYAREYDGCLAGCDKTNPREHDTCVSYCRCVIDGTQAQFADHDQLMREMTEQKLADRIARLQKLANSCNQQLWRNPARKLKFQ